MKYKLRCYDDTVYYAYYYKTRNIQFFDLKYRTSDLYYYAFNTKNGYTEHHVSFFEQEQYDTISHIPKPLHYIFKLLYGISVPFKAPPKKPKNRGNPLERQRDPFANRGMTR